MLKEKLYPVREIRDLKDMLEQSCTLFGDKPAFLIKEGEGSFKPVSYKQYNEDVEALGTALLALGLNNEAIAVLGENRYEWCVTYLSVVNGVGTIVPIDKELPSNEVKNLLVISEARAIVFSGKYRNQMKVLTDSLPSVSLFIDMDLEQDEAGILSFKGLLDRGKEMVKTGDEYFNNAVIDPDAMHMLIFTSGTTEAAKGVMLSHRNICSNITSVRSTVYVGKNDTSLSILPLHHTYECTLGFLTLIYSGATIAFNEGLKHIAKNMLSVKPTIMVTVPLLIENIHRRIAEKIEKEKLTRIKFKAALIFTNLLAGALKIDIRKKAFKAIHDNFGGRLRLIITGAAAVKPEVSRFFRRLGIPVLQGYGLTECSPLVAGNRDRSFRDSSCGKAIPGVEVQIMNPDAKGIGEIAVKGSNVMLGYYKNEKETNKCVRDGWFYTGDLGYLGKKGFLYITGRLKNVIVTKNGKKIFPEEVESYINSNPLVQDSLVWGKYDESSGDTIVCAQILPNLEAISEKLKGMSVTKEDLMNIIKEIVGSVNNKMPLYKHIRQFSLREKEFIRTTTQKIKRYMEKPPQGDLL